MDLFELSAVLGLDLKPYKKGIQTALDIAGEMFDVLTAFGKDVLETGMGFDKQMSAVQAVLGTVEGTEENMIRLRAFALDQARDSIFTAEQTAEAYYYMGLAGWDAEQLIAGLPGVMSLAAASGESLQSVSEVLVTSLSALGMTADDTQTLVDILATTATNSVTDVGEMGQAFQYAAQQAGALGVDAEDLALTLGLLANQAITGTSAGTMVRTMFTRLSANVSGARDTFESLGTTVFDEQGRMRDWSTILEEARVGWAKLTDEQKQQYAYTITGMRGISGLNALLGATEGQYNDLKTAIDGAAGSAQTMADVRLDSLAGDVDMFNSALDTLKIAIYDDVKGPLRDVVQWGTGALKDITDAINENGLAGGIDKLSEKIRELANDEHIQGLLRSIGQAIVPILNEVLNNLAPSLIEAIPKLAGELLKALGDAMVNGGDGVGGLLGVLVGGAGYGLDIFSKVTGFFRTVGAESGAAMSEEIVGQFDPLMHPENVVPFSDWLNAGCDPYMIPDGIYNATEEKAPDISGVTSSAIEQGVANGVESAEPHYRTFAENVARHMEETGTDGGKNMAVNIGTELSTAEPGMRDGLVNTLSEAGDPIGANLADGIYDQLINTPFQINVTANVSGLPGVQRNASAMAGGRIYRHPTIFGYDNGAFQMAGDAGAEAVVGVNSLSAMITNAVNRGMAGQEIVVPRSNAGGGRDITIVLEMDKTQFAKTVYRANNDETQRVGVRIAGVNG